METTNYSVLDYPEILQSSVAKTYMSPMVNEIVAAMCRFNMKINNLSKNRSGFNYKYADLANYIDATRVLLSQHDMIITQLTSKDIDGNPVLITLLLHKSGQFFESVIDLVGVHVLKRDGTPSTNDLQALGSGLTYVRRYAIQSILYMSQHDDDDDGATAAATTKTNERSTQKTNVSSKSPLSIAYDSLKDLCESHDVNINKFGKFHKLDSHSLSSLTNAIEAFDEMSRLYNESIGNKV